jgi:hypothetical protein
MKILFCLYVQMNTFIPQARRYSKMQSTTGVRSHVPLIKAFYLLEDIQTPQMRVDCRDKRITEILMTLTFGVQYIFVAVLIIFICFCMAL